MSDWLHDVFHDRPWWMNAVMVFCAFMTFVYMPWDIFVKPVEADAEVWFGILFTGRVAKWLALAHWLVYAGALYGLRKTRPWMAIAAPLYLGQVTFSMFVWTFVYYDHLLGIFLGIIAALPFAGLTAAFWYGRDVFLAEREALGERYGGYALITGASAGIGEAFARACAREGMNLVLVARRRDRLESLGAELTRAFSVDVRVLDIDLVHEGAAARVAEAVNDLDIGLIVNNAGFGYQGRFESLELTRLEEMVQLNCTVPMALTHHLLPGLRQRGRSAVIVVGSAAGRQPLPLHGVYSATKAFGQFFAESLAVEEAASNVDVLVVEPGTVETEFQQVSGQLEHPGASPDDVVESSLEALGHQSSVIVGWKNWLRAVLATRLAPRPLVAQLARHAMEASTPEERR